VLSPAERLGHAHVYSLNFLRVPAPFRPAAKELFAQLLDDDLMPRGKPYATSSIRVHFTGVLVFLQFLTSKRLTRLSEVTPRHYGEYVGYLGALGKLRDSHLRSARLFWTYRDRLTDPLPADPEAMVFWRAAPEAPRGENKTQRIPEEILNPLIWWSSRLVDELSGDILSFGEEHRNLLTAQASRPSISRGRGDASSRVTALLTRYRASGEPLPGHYEKAWQGRPNYRALDREAGVPTGLTIRIADYQVRALAEDNGVDSDTFLRSRPSATLLDVPWSGRITYREVPGLCRTLQTAAYVLIAFFSGMRDSEVKHIKRGCIRTDSDSTGRLQVHRLHGTTFKGNDDPHGKAAHWIVSPIVKRAVEVLERLADPGEEYLFRPLRFGTSHNRSDTKSLVSGSETNTNLNKLVDWANGRAVGIPGSPKIARADGTRWQLSTRQFRRTLAWFIARRPGGVAAGALQYKHLSLQMFRGYAGESRSGFADEVAGEQALARGEWLGEFAQDAHSVVGRAKDEVVRRLDSMGSALGFAGQLPESPAQLTRFLKRHDPYIYRGAAVTCVFDRTKALCMRKEPSAPDLLSCEPLRCANAVFTPEDIAAWRDRASGLAEVAADESRAPRVRASAADHSARLIAFFDALQGSA
jgi:hypothetical protein